ncbi:YhgE/Pip domain-containing protein [Mumia zhuanghuii]|uniref:YhgE/Pip family protein n=2 Tax=Mumia TaxID=1546255 RepID=A0ABW1QKT8_9ACTN|nr:MULTISPECIES: YhgE/Pip domain-containing protein [Mumia]KAA1419936.1 YhgE/Pip domain-containing protein [Mumia zhuanghuii]
MTAALRMAWTEVRRLTTGRLPRLAILALVLIPSLYAGFYLWANHDPYARLASLDAALVVDDRPAKTAQGETIDVGNEVADDLVADGTFTWHRVSDAEAEAGVRDGTYSFSLTITEDFSSALASTSDFEPERGTLVLTTNDANNYLAHTIADQLLLRVSGSIAERVSEQAASTFLLGYSTLHDQLKRAADGVTELTNGLSEAASGADTLHDGAARLASGERSLVNGQEELADGVAEADAGAGRLATGAATLASGLGTLESRTTALPSQTKALSQGARQVADGNARLAEVGDEVGDVADDLEDSLDTVRAEIVTQLADPALGLTPAQQQEVIANLDTLREPLEDAHDQIDGVVRDLDRLRDGSDQVADGARRLHQASRPLVRGITEAHDGSVELRDGTRTLAGGLDAARSGSSRLVEAQRTAARGASQLEEGSGTLATGIDEAHDGAKSLADGLRSGLGQVPDLADDDREDMAQTLASPVTTKNVSQADAGSYGGGLAPFFMGLAAWIGAYVMFLIVRPLSRRGLAARRSPALVALAGWFTPALLSAFQVLVMLGIIRLAVGIDFVNALKVALFLLLVGACFVAIVHALNVWLGAVGQLIGLVLLVVQLVSAGGTFPWQTLPEPLQVVHHLMPMSYAIEGMRHLMYGASLGPVPGDVAVLGGYLLASLALTAWAARVQRTWTPSRIEPELAL